MVPAVDALQVEAAAEGRAEGGERQQADGQRIGADVLQQLSRHQRAQRNSEQHQHGLGQDRRHRQRPSGDRGDGRGDHGAGDQPARKMRHQKQQSSGGADNERFEHVWRDWVRLGIGDRHRCRNPDHAALWQIRLRRQMQQCDAAMRGRRFGALASLALPDGGGVQSQCAVITAAMIPGQAPGIGRRTRSVADTSRSHPPRERLIISRLAGCPWPHLLAIGHEFLALLAIRTLCRRPPSSIRARPRMRGLAAFFFAGAILSVAAILWPAPLGSGSILARARRFAQTPCPSAAAKRRRSQPHGKKSSSWKHLGLKEACKVALRC